MIDWNNNGKHDAFDSFMEYQIYKDVMEDSDNTYSASSKRKNDYKNKQSVNTSTSKKSFKDELDTFTTVLIILAILGWIIFFFRLGTKNADSNNYSSSYHYTTRVSSYYADDYTDSSSKTVITTHKTSTYSHTTKNYIYDNSSRYDEYNVYDYDDPEDFYEDNYDDFYDFEDAEDYFDEAWDE